MWGWKRVVLLLTDAAPYMLKAGKTLKLFYKDLIHVTCAAHAANRVAEKVRDFFPDVNTLTLARFWLIMILMVHLAETEPSDKVLSKRDLSWFWWDHAQSSSTTPLPITLVTTSQSESTRSMLAQLAHEDFLDSDSGNCPLSCLFVVCGHEDGPRMKEESSLRRFFKKATALPTNRTTKEDKEKVVYLPEDLPLNEDFYDSYCSTSISPPQVFESLPMAFFIGGVHCFLQCINAFLPGRASGISKTTVPPEAFTLPISTIASEISTPIFLEFTLHPEDNLTASTNYSALELTTTFGEYAATTTLVQTVDISSTELSNLEQLPISQNDTLSNVFLNFLNDTLPSGEPVYYELLNATESAESSLTGKVEFYELPPASNESEELASSSTALLYDIPTMSNNQIYDHIQRMKSTSTTPHPIFIINSTNLTTEFSSNVSFSTENWTGSMLLTSHMKDSKVAGFFKNIKMKLSKDLNPKKSSTKTSPSPEGETITHHLRPDSGGANASEQLFDPNTAYGKGVVEMFLHYFRNWMGTFASTKSISKDNNPFNETTPMFSLISLDTAHLTKTHEDTSTIQSDFYENLATISKGISQNNSTESNTSNSIEYSSISTETYTTENRIGILDLYTYILPLHIPENSRYYQLATSGNLSDSIDTKTTMGNLRNMQSKELQSKEKIQIFEIPSMGDLFQENEPNETTISQFFENSRMFEDNENVNTIQPEKHFNLSDDELLLAKSTKHYKNKYGILHKVNDSKAANFLKNMLGISKEPSTRTVCDRTDSNMIRPTKVFSMKMLKKGDKKNSNTPLREGEELQSVGTEGRASQTIARPVNKMRLKRRRHKRDLRDPYRFHLTYGLYPMDKVAFSQALARSAHVLKEMKSPPIPRMAWNTRRKDSKMDLSTLVQRRRFCRNRNGSPVQKRSWINRRRPAKMGENIMRYPRRVGRKCHVSGSDPFYRT